jgi:hypothetical protein
MADAIETTMTTAPRRPAGPDRPGLIAGLLLGGVVVAARRTGCRPDRRLPGQAADYGPGAAGSEVVLYMIVGGGPRRAARRPCHQGH